MNGVYSGGDMREHLELSDSSNEVIRFVKESQITLVMCKGCGCKRPINSEYAAYVVNGIESCRFCREGDLG